MTQRNFKKSEQGLLQMIARFTGPSSPHQRVHEGTMHITGLYASAVAANASVSRLSCMRKPDG